jgi:class 3 adenylate cyclase/tetratricopeptide (TPR) repeat protein
MNGGSSCPSCGARNQAGQRFCGSCGAALAQPCPNCGAPNPIDQPACTSCGTPLVTDRHPDAEPRPERRRATVLFADVTGWTSLVEDLDPEDVQGMVHEVSGLMGDEVHRFGGTVISVMGDGIMAVFGAPIAHEDDAERAVRAAAAMRDAVSRIEGPLAGVSLHIGVNTGEGMAGLVGPEGRRDYSVVGDVTNTAARLQGHAEPGEILVGAETHADTEGVVEYAEREPIVVKGKRDPVAVWTLVSILPRAPDRPEAAPMVGRQRELALIDSLWERTVASGQPHLVTVSGLPGIGKSRLIREAVRSIERTGRQLRGRCLPFGQTTGVGPFGQQVKQCAGILDSDPEPAARATLQEHIRSLLPSNEASEVDAHLAIVLGLSSDRVADRQLVFRSARRYVEALAEEQPTALIFEDLHWAEPTLVELIGSLAGRVRDRPLLMLTSARPGFFDAVSSWGADLPYLRVPLEPLTETEANELASTLMRQGRRDSETILELVTTSGGNPLFLEELASSVSEGGAVGQLPTTIQGIIAARLDVLPRVDRSLLQQASVVGRVFWRGSLIAMGNDAERLDDGLDSLEARDLIVRQPTSRLADDAEYLFKHVLTQEVAYATLPRRTRRELHGTVARYLEDALGERVRGTASVLAHHWTEAEDPARALDYLMMAAEVAAGAAAKTEAVDLFGRAIDLATELGDRVRLEQAAFGRIWARIDIADYATALQEVEAWLNDPDPRTRSRAAHARSRLAFMLMDVPSLRELADRTAGIADELGDVRLGRRAMALAGIAAFLEGDGETYLDTAEAVAKAWPAGERGVEYGFTMSFVPLQYYWDGRYLEGAELGRAAYDLGVELASVYLMLFNIGGLGLNLAGLSRYEEAIDWLERGAAMGREWETKPQWTGRTLNMHAGTLREIGDLAGARRLSEEGLEAGLAASFVATSVSARIDLATIDLLEGDVGRVESQLPGLVEAVEGFRGWHQWLWAERLADMRSLVALGSGRYADAVRLADEALKYLGRYPRPKYEAKVHTTRGEALLGLGRPVDAVAAFRRAQNAADRTGQAALQWPALDGLARALERADRDGSDAAAAARISIEGIAAGLSDERQERFLGWAPILAVLGRAG